MPKLLKQLITFCTQTPAAWIKGDRADFRANAGFLCTLRAIEAKIPHCALLGNVPYRLRGPANSRTLLFLDLRMERRPDWRITSSGPRVLARAATV
jgi:hypothetical protein